MTKYKKVSYFFEMYFRIFRIFVFWYLYLYYVLVYRNVLVRSMCEAHTMSDLPPVKCNFLYPIYWGRKFNIL